jgi:hypothetical protein
MRQKYTDVTCLLSVVGGENPAAQMGLIAFKAQMLECLSEKI